MTTAIAIQKETASAQWSPDQIDLVRRTVAKDATDDELKMFCHLAQTYGLDPFAKEIWFIKRGGAPTIMTSRDGYLKIANGHPQFRGMASDAVYAGDAFERTPEGVRHVYAPLDKRGGLQGAYALVYRADRTIPIYVFAPFKDYNSGQSTWQKYPHAMIVKVAESMALKRAFSLSGLVSREEMDAAQDEEEPRQQAPRTPSTTPVEPEIVDLPAKPEAQRKAPSQAQGVQILFRAMGDQGLGWTPDEMKAFVRDRTGKTSTKDLTEADLKSLIGEVRRRLARRDEAQAGPAPARSEGAEGVEDPWDGVPVPEEEVPA